MLRFVIESDRDRENPFLRYAIFELGVRLNVQFSIQHAVQDANTEDALLLYGVNCEPSSGLGRVLRLPCSSMEQKCTPIRNKEAWCYAATADRSLDVIAGAASLLSFACEVELNRDRLGRIAAEAHPLRNHFSEPLLENNAAYLKHEIESAFGELRPISTPFGKKVGACVLTHDVDGPQLHTPFALGRSLLLGLRGHGDEMESFALGISTLLTRKPDPYWNFENWARLEKEMRGCSTFFVYPGPTASAHRHRLDPRYHPARSPFPRTLKALAADGWEIGVHHGIEAHGLAAYAESRKALHEITGVEATGCRTHYWAGVWNDPYHTWNAMDRAGFGYDASLSPLSLGYRSGSMLPTMPSMKWRRKAGDGFVVLPTAVMDSYANPRLSSLSAAEISAAMDRLVANTRHNGLLVADWHVRTLINAGAHRGQLSAFLSTIHDLSTDTEIALLTATQAAESWRVHCARCYVEVQW
jgi:hypothetical protein